jgi:hypothetical protein
MMAISINKEMAGLILGTVVGVVSLFGGGIALGYQMGSKAGDENKELLTRQGNECQETVKALQTRQIELSRNPAEQNAPSQMPAEPSRPKITVQAGSTGEIQGKLTISVVAITPSPVGEPLQYVVKATFGAPGLATKEVPSMKVGDRITFAKYEILLAEADLTRARFAISPVP